MKNILLSAAFLVFISKNNYADSPVTETFFSYYYAEYDIVNYAATGRMDEKIANYLLDEKNLIDVKAAVINAISWSYEGKDNARIFKEFLAKKKGTTSENLSLANLTGSELMCLGYLTAMDNYFETTEALQFLEAAKMKMPKSFTVNLIYTLLKSQQDYETNFCIVWQNTSALLNDHTLKRDIKTAAIQSVVNYLLNYKQYCYSTSGE